MPRWSPTWRRVNVVTMAGATDAALPGAGRARRRQAAHPRRRVRRRRHAAAESRAGRPKRRLPVELVGVDLNPRSEGGGAAAYPTRTADPLDHGDYADLAGGGWDVILSSLVAPSYDARSLIAFLRFMEPKPRVAGWSTTCIGTVSRMRAFRCWRGSRAGIRSCGMTARCRSRAPIVQPNGRRCSQRRVSPMRGCSAPSPSGYASNGCADRRRRGRPDRPRRSAWRAAA